MHFSKEYVVPLASPLPTSLFVVPKPLNYCCPCCCVASILYSSTVRTGTVQHGLPKDRYVLVRRTLYRTWFGMRDTLRVQPARGEEEHSLRVCTFWFLRQSKHTQRREAGSSREHRVYLSCKFAQVPIRRHFRFPRKQKELLLFGPHEAERQFPNQHYYVVPSFFLNKKIVGIADL